MRSCLPGRLAPPPSDQETSQMAGTAHSRRTPPGRLGPPGTQPGIEGKPAAMQAKPSSTRRPAPDAGVSLKQLHWPLGPRPTSRGAPAQSCRSYCLADRADAPSGTGKGQPGRTVSEGTATVAREHVRRAGTPSSMIDKWCSGTEACRPRPSVRESHAWARLTRRR